MASVINIVVLLAVLSVQALAVRVRVSDGLLEGERVFNEYGGGQYYSFKGIPYAQPPLGNLRFKWKPYSLQQQDYLDLGNRLVAGKAPDAEEIQFWENTLTEFGQRLY
uniref:Carboxylesterase type B domain-containing protein n=1 Tax=Heliothis virescens TaxID=7102 RepID=A0A2A4K8L1_HELVI